MTYTRASHVITGGRIAPNTFETAPRTCIECGETLESWQASRCQACVDKSLVSVVTANSARWADDDDPVSASCACPKCGERDADNLAIDEDEVVTCQICGEVYDISPAARLDRVAVEDLGDERITAIERILSETQGRRGSNPHYAVSVLDAGPLCYIGQ